MIASPPTTPPQQTGLKVWAAVCINNGETRRLTVEATDEAEARALCLRLGVGFDGEATRPDISPAPLPVAYDQKTARHLLGGISRTNLYKELVLGRLQRVPGTRRVLVTRSSIEAWPRRR